MSIADNIESVSRRIQKATDRCDRARAEVTLLAVSKTRTPADLLEAIAAGQRVFAESYLQEALDKMSALADQPGLEWHFIGPVQSNKTRDIANHFDWVHSVDRLKIARRLNAQRDPDLKPLNICLQVNIDNEPSKSGCRPEELPALAQAMADLPQLSLRGLMAIPDPNQTEAGLRQSFQKLAGALSHLKEMEQGGAGPLDSLSMGMSSDLEIAIEEGATLVRVGTAIFGKRPAKS
ncbi:MAG: YggS family pyridoxal phosphate-dependent enzyme [Oleiphilaceae bacterium]|nr:YggS family pyridoxal phosphate-dependent enzyme [Oleiphilaceae bacterium]